MRKRIASSLLLLASLLTACAGYDPATGTFTPVPAGGGCLEDSDCESGLLCLASDCGSELMPFASRACATPCEWSPDHDDPVCASVTIGGQPTHCDMICGDFQCVRAEQ